MAINSIKCVIMKEVTKFKGILPSFPGFEDFWDNSPWFSDDMFKRHFYAVPSVNIRENKDHFLIEMAAPGLDKNDFNIEVSHGLLTISVEKSVSEETEEDDYTRREFNFSRFSRCFRIPENVDADKIEARYNEGVLALMLAKKEMVEKTKHLVEVE